MSSGFLQTKFPAFSAMAEVVSPPDRRSVSSPEPDVQSSNADGFSISLPLDIQLLILEAADVSDQFNLARVCVFWQRCLQTSSVARLKRYAECPIYYDFDLFRPPAGDEIPDKLLVHRLLAHQEQYTYRDELEVERKQPEERRRWPFQMQSPYAGLRIFEEDPVFIVPPSRITVPEKLRRKAVALIDNSEESKSEENKEEQSISDHSGTKETDARRDDGGITVALTQSASYKYFNSGRFPSKIGTGYHIFPTELLLKQSTTIKDYTQSLVNQMKILAKITRNDRVIELTRSSKDTENVTALWERLTAPEPKFEFEIWSRLCYEGHCIWNSVGWGAEFHFDLADFDWTYGHFDMWDLHEPDF